MTHHRHDDILTDVRGCVGCVTLNRPGALNALTPSMISHLAACLLAWRDNPQVQAVAIRGSNKAGPFGAFCAGGDIRLFHQALRSGDLAAEDFFTEEYALNHLIQHYPKPYLAFLDGVTMGGGMGLCQGRSLAEACQGGYDGGVVRLVTARSKLAMPETLIGLFPDVGGGYFLSRCPGHTGEWLALTGAALGAADAIALGLADHYLDADVMPQVWEALGQLSPVQASQPAEWLGQFVTAAPAAVTTVDQAQIDRFFSLPTVSDIVQALEADPGDWAQRTAGLLRQRSPLMLHVALAQVRRGRGLSLAEDLRMERDMVHHCFSPQHLGRTGAESETAEGIRALVVDKDNAPQWQPTRIEDVTPEMVQGFFVSPWAAESHPLRALA